MSLSNTTVAPLSVDHEYEISVVRFFTIMAVFWGIIGMTVGVFIASQLAWPILNFDTAWLSFGRLRPLHTNAVIFAFGGSALFATSWAWRLIFSSNFIRVVTILILLSMYEVIYCVKNGILFLHPIR